jgi:hypothetical protein
MPCCEIVTPSSTFFINHLLSTAMAMSNKWKASYNSNRKYTSKWEETFVWMQKDWRQLIVNCATATFYQELKIGETQAENSITRPDTT